jgi:hypothetical protein
MNFLELYEELIEVLAENSSAAPQYWSAAELKRYLNRANAELTRRSGLGRMLLPLQPAELGAFYAPTDLLKLLKVYYNGKQLDHKSVDFLDAHYGGTDHQQIHSGDGKTYSSNWRTETGIPIHWYFENDKIKLYPTPETDPAASSPAVIRGKLTGTILAGATGITLSGVIPADQNRVDFYYNGVYQNKDQWSISAGNAIAFSGWSTVADGVYEIVYIPDTTTLLTIQKSEKYLINISAGQTAINIPGGYTPGIGALAVRINGINQAPAEWTENFTNYITLTTAPIIDSIVEVTVTRPDPALTVSVLYVQAPNKMVGNLDRPQISNEDHQRGIVHYAAHLALSKEGKMTQDLQKSQIHLARFEEVIEAIASLTKPQVDISPYVQMPFKV